VPFVPLVQPVNLSAPVVLPVYVINSVPINIVPEVGKFADSVKLISVALFVIAPFNV
jgi:hypothetical protein